MNILVFSDLHGDLEASHHLYIAIKRHNPDLIICLGDIFTYDFNDSDDVLIAKSLNRYLDKMILIRGNCDDNIRSKYLEMPFYTYKELYVLNKKYLFTHGHILNNLDVSYEDYDVIVVGHTHSSFIKFLNNGTLIVNPGSIAFPKESSVKTYMIIANNEIKIYDVQGILQDIKIVD